MMQRSWQMLLSLMLLALVQSVAGCSSVPTRWLPSQQAAIPPLPSEARQEPTPLICSPTCSTGLASELKNLRELQTVPD